MAFLIENIDARFSMFDIQLIEKKYFAKFQAVRRPIILLPLSQF